MASPKHHQSDRYRTAIAMTIARAWKSEKFRKQLLENPKAVVEETGLSFPKGVQFKVYQSTDKITYINLVRDLNIVKRDQGVLLQVLNNVLPIKEGHEVRIVQSSESVRNLVIPHLPDHVDAQQMPEADLLAVATAQSSTATATETVAVTQGVTVQTGAEATTVATTAEVVAEAVAVAT